MIRAALAVTTCVLLAACGARLSPAQQAEADAAARGRLVPAVQADQPGAVTSPGPGAPGALPGAVPSGSAGSPTAAAGPTRPAGSPAPGSPTRVVPTPGTTTAPAQATNPLAGPGGATCPPGAKGSGPGVTYTEIRIGNISTVNGPLPGLFTTARRGTQAFVSYLNSIGGICGRKVVLEAADDHFDTATNRTLAQSLSSRVMALVGGFSLNDSGTAAAIAASGMPAVQVTSSKEMAGSPHSFSPNPQPPGFITGPYKYFQKRFGPEVTEHMALLVANVPQTAGVGKYQRDALLSLGYKFPVEYLNVEPTQTQFGAEIAQMKQKGIKGIIFLTTAGVSGALAQQAHAAGLRFTFANWGPQAYDKAFADAAGPGLEGTVLWSSYGLFLGADNAAVPAVGLFSKWYSQIDPGGSPDTFAAIGWTSGWLWAQGLNAGGAPTREALAKGISKLTAFDAGGFQAPTNPGAKKPGDCWLVISVKNGKFVRDPQGPARGFRCNPSGYFYEPKG